MNKPKDCIVSRRDLALTYDPPQEDLDGWELIQQHQEALDYAAANPDSGSYAVANAIEAPRSRVRPWIEGDSPAIPDAARGVQTAERRGWTPITLNDDAHRLASWNTLAAGLFAGGSINSNYEPRWAPHSDRERARITAALDELGITWDDVHVDVDDRATEIDPQKSSVLGRVFATLGCPVGEKATADLTLPAYLGTAPDWLCQQFAVVYVANRAEGRFPEGDSNASGLRLREHRPESYLNELAIFLSRATGEQVTRPGDDNLYLSDAARSRLVAFDRRDRVVSDIFGHPESS